jgi:hypothetical protein
MSNIDIFIKTYHGDFIWLEYCLKSVKKYAKGFRNIIVVSDNDENLIPDSIIDILPIKLFYTDVPKIIPKNCVQSTGYLWQQIIKLSWVDYTDADAVFVLDSDEMLSKELNPSSLITEDGKFRWFYRNWEFSRDAIVWKEPTKKILNIEPQYEAMCEPGFVLERNTTEKFIEYITKIHSANTIWHSFFNADIICFSEYNAYGSYVYNFDNDEKYFKIINGEDKTLYNCSIIKSWSWGGLSEEDKEKRDALL